ncbi:MULTISPECIES: alkaline phosphatase family protein [Streptomyces]|uniref:alkaline phosphatase family protein n=1 Tax=unclassified Streptomyces TaxID=2593676 RepID=UPI0007C68BE8|nr:putative Ig domain-containing protein [Streptomyces sp. MUM 16J]
MHSRPRLVSAAAVLGVAAGLTAATPAQAASVPTPDHVVVVIEENHSYGDVIGDTTDAPYLNSLATQGADFTDSHAITHPSQPNYYDLFSGGNQGITSDSCVTPGFSSAANLGSELLEAGKTFASYNESLPSQGWTGCTSGAYARKHNPWFGFSNVPTSTAHTFGQFPTDYATLPDVSFVIPNLDDDMHDGTVKQGDTWLKNNLGAYATWAKSHNSLLAVTWDEDDGSTSNQIPTIFYGAGVKAGDYSETINHYNVLRTLEDAYGLAATGNASSATPITDIWSTQTGNTVTVTDPGNQSTTAGSAARLQIKATDSAGAALTYSATGLPAGLTTDSSTGLISGTPTTAGTSDVTVTAKDSTGASGSVSFTWTVTSPPGGGCTAQQLLGNPGFETGSAAPWTATSGVISNASSQTPHSGSWYAWLDGYGSTHTDTLAQTVTIPAGCTAGYSFWLHVDTSETTTSRAYDTLTAQVLDGSGKVLGTLATYSNLDAANGYTQRTFDLTPYAGQTVTLEFTGSEDSSLQTSFVIDDTALDLS